MEPATPMTGYGWPLMVALYAVLVIVPVWRILRRVGYSGWWSLLAVVAPLNLILLWIFAFIDWPRLPKRAAGEGS